MLNLWVHLVMVTNKLKKKKKDDSDFLWKRRKSPRLGSMTLPPALLWCWLGQISSRKLRFPFLKLKVEGKGSDCKSTEVSLLSEMPEVQEANIPRFFHSPHPLPTLSPHMTWVTATLFISQSPSSAHGEKAPVKSNGSREKWLRLSHHAPTHLGPSSSSLLQTKSPNFS